MTEYHFSKQLCHSFYQVNKLFNQFYIKTLKEFDLTYTQYLVLFLLWEESPLSLKTLGENLNLASNTLTPLLKRLENKGYIQRLVPKQDKRQLLIHITDKGKCLQSDIEAQLYCCFQQLQGLNKEKTEIYLQNNLNLIRMLQDYLNQTELSEQNTSKSAD